MTFQEELNRIMELSGINEYRTQFGDKTRTVDGPFIMDQYTIDKYDCFRQSDLGRPYLKINGRFCFYDSIESAEQAKHKLTLL